MSNVQIIAGLTLAIAYAAPFVIETRISLPRLIGDLELAQLVRRSKLDFTAFMLDAEIETLRSIMPDAPPSFSKVHRSDWRPFWQLAGKIQARFKEGVHYPTKELRDEAWRRFNELRDEANRRVTEERERMRYQSEEIRDVIFSKCSGITWSPVTDTIFFFDQTTKDQVKAWGRYLAEAMQMLSKHKQEMISEHKQQCFDKFQEIKESHDLFWQQFKETQQANWEEKKAARRRNRSEFVAKIESNIQNNREKLNKAMDALNRQRGHADDLRDKIRESTSRKWEDIHRTWLNEAETKIEDIESSIKRIEEWIEEDRHKLEDFGD
jgi:hypothetical protein